MMDEIKSLKEMIQEDSSDQWDMINDIGAILHDLIKRVQVLEGRIKELP